MQPAGQAQNHPAPAAPRQAPEAAQAITETACGLKYAHRHANSTTSGNAGAAASNSAARFMAQAAIRPHHYAMLHHDMTSETAGRPICSSLEGSSGRRPSRTSRIAQPSRPRPHGSAIPSCMTCTVRARRRRPSEHAKDIAAGKQAARQHHYRPPPLSSFDRRPEQQPLGHEAAARRHVPSGQSRQGRRRTISHRQRAADAAEARRCGHGRALRRPAPPP